MNLNPKLQKELHDAGIELTPLDIHGKEFDKGGLFSRKYDADEVDLFLDQIIKEYGSFYNVLQEMHKELEALTEAVLNKGDISVENLHVRVKKIERYLLDFRKTK